MRIIGITGTLGAGKGTIVEYLMANHGFQHYSVRAYLTREIERRGMPLNRDSMVTVANELRASNSPSFIAEELYREAAANGADCIIESIRTPGEIDALQDTGNFTLLAVDAPARTRYDRILKRGSSTDQVDFETFVANEEREMTTTDPNAQNLKTCMGRADFALDNSGSFEALYAQVEVTLRRIKPAGSSLQTESKNKHV
jgi:dephospho-CoA kinase